MRVPRTCCYSDNKECRTNEGSCPVSPSSGRPDRVFAAARSVGSVPRALSHWRQARILRGLASRSARSPGSRGLRRPGPGRTLPRRAPRSVGRRDGARTPGGRVHGASAGLNSRSGQQDLAGGPGVGAALLVVRMTTGPRHRCKCLLTDGTGVWLTPWRRASSPAGVPASPSFRIATICSSVKRLLRMATPLLRGF
jgi:hypothetical protein